MDFMQYWRATDLAGTTGARSGASPAWAVAYSRGRAVNRESSAAESAASRDPAAPVNNQAAIFRSGSGANTASITQALTKEHTAAVVLATAKLATIPISNVLISGLATNTAAPASLAAGVGVLDVSWYQPKWQKNDYYQHNYRINHGDSVTVKVCSPIYGLTTAAYTTATNNAAARTLKEYGGGNLQGVMGTSAASALGAVTWYASRYSGMTGLLPEVVPKGTAKQDSTCTWADKVVVTAGPKNGAAAMIASMTALALGAAALAI